MKVNRTNNIQNKICCNPRKNGQLFSLLFSRKQHLQMLHYNVSASLYRVVTYTHKIKINKNVHLSAEKQSLPFPINCHQIFNFNFDFKKI